MSAVDRVQAIRAQLEYFHGEWQVGADEHDGKYVVPLGSTCPERLGTHWDVGRGEAKLIANAPADLAWLLEENARLQEQVSDLARRL